MKLLHTKLPDFMKKMYIATTGKHPEKTIQIRGLENLHNAKMQSLRTGRIEKAVEEMAEREDVASIDFVVMPRVPETMHTVAVKGLDSEGNVKKVVLEVINILHPTEEIEFGDCTDIEDHRPPIGLH